MDASDSQRRPGDLRRVVARAAPLIPTASDVPKWKCVVIHLKVKGACHEAYDDRIGFGKTDIPSAFS
jgi:hypothetical protein